MKISTFIYLLEDQPMLFGLRTYSGKFGLHENVCFYPLSVILTMYESLNFYFHMLLDDPNHASQVTKHSKISYRKYLGKIGLNENAFKKNCNSV